MRIATAIVVALLLSGLSFAQQPFTNVLLVIQENRTVDNLFGSSPPAGMDVQTVGFPVPLGTTADIPHNHASFLRERSGVWPPLAKNYVRQPDIQPYLDIAAQYGVANYMFQTNQGPSQPAHDDLFGATSAPSRPGEPYSDWFAAENGGQCNTSLSQQAMIDPAGVEHNLPACKDHDTLASLMISAGISWRYYTPTAGNIWTAPAGIYSLCLPSKGKCTGPQWANVILNPAAVLTDIQNGTLAQMSWVIPAGVNSDHPGYGSGGPAWVSSIVNAVMSSPFYSQTTAVIVVWDDWGGWYDHVTPMVNNTGWCMIYCYGNRVPMLVVSSRTPAGYVSNLPMDFGSILRFVETNFNLPRIGNGTYADAYAQWDDGFFSTAKKRSTFRAIKARELTKAELESRSDPDDE